MMICTVAVFPLPASVIVTGIVVSAATHAPETRWKSIMTAAGGVVPVPPPVPPPTTTCDGWIKFWLLAGIVA